MVSVAIHHRAVTSSRSLLHAVAVVAVAASCCYHSSFVTVSSFEFKLAARHLHRRHQIPYEPTMTRHLVHCQCTSTRSSFLTHVSSLVVGYTPTTVALASPPPPPPASVVVELDPPDIIQKALLMDPECTIVDVRGIDEIKATGIFNPQSAIRNGLRWISAPCTLQECSPLLEDPAICDVMIRSKTAPLVVHCASGKRANIAKQVLLSHGYTNVYNAGAYPNDTKQYE